MSVSGFEDRGCAVGEASYFVARGGEGPPVLLLHGFHAYRRALTPATITAMCADYRASFHLDRQHDADDRAAGRLITAPVLLVIGEDEAQLADAPDVWRAWAQDLTATQVPGGHFSPEEASQKLAKILAAFLDPDEFR